MNNIKLDIGCGRSKKAGYVGLDKRSLEEVDIVHDLEIFPYPLPDECCEQIFADQIIEHIKPWFTIDFINELWRIMKYNGILTVITPQAGSQSYWQDPTHCNGCNVGTFMYFDQRFPLWEIYEPLPWRIFDGYPMINCNGHIEVKMKKTRLSSQGG